MIKGVGINRYGGVDVLEAIEMPKPQPSNKDLLVNVKAVSVNPVDTKVRHNRGNPDANIDTRPKILGWDASGVVEQLGSEVSGFKVGDEVYFAGAINRNGSNAEYTLVDYRIASLKPKTLDHAHSASLPLVSLTAWEGLVEQLMIPADDTGSNQKKSLLVVGAAGGVGSIVVQLAKRILRVGNVVATASRPETIQFVKELGADNVIDHRQDLGPQLQALGLLSGVNYIFNCATTDDNIHQLIPLLSVLGRIVNITEASKPVDLSSMFAKRASVTFEFMFNRPVFNEEPEKQGKILEQIAHWIDQGTIRHTTTKVYERLTPETIKEVHQILQNGTAIGKIVLKANF